MICPIARAFQGRESRLYGTILDRVTEAWSPELELECVISKKRCIRRGCWLAAANVWSDVECQGASPCCSVENIDRIRSFQRRETNGGAVRTPGSLGVTEEDCKNKQLRSEEHTNSSALNPNVCVRVCVWKRHPGFLAFASWEGKHG